MSEITQEPYGTGFLSIGDGTLSTPAHGIGTASPGRCPKCQTPAAPWIPPVFDDRYMRRVQAIREVQKLDSDGAAHRHYLRETGGYIETCLNCTTSFFVPSAVATVKTEV